MTGGMSLVDTLGFGDGATWAGDADKLGDGIVKELFTAKGDLKPLYVRALKGVQKWSYARHEPRDCAVVLSRLAALNYFLAQTK